MFVETRDNIIVTYGTPRNEYFQPRDTAGEFSTALRPLLLPYLDFGQNSRTTMWKVVPCNGGGPCRMTRPDWSHCFPAKNTSSMN